jgi:hypothetical protein
MDNINFKAVLSQLKKVVAKRNRDVQREAGREFLEDLDKRQALATVERMENSGNWSKLDAIYEYARNSIKNEKTRARFINKSDPYIIAGLKPLWVV